MAQTDKALTIEEEVDPSVIEESPVTEHQLIKSLYSVSPTMEEMKIGESKYNCVPRAKREEIMSTLWKENRNQKIHQQSNVISSASISNRHTQAQPNPAQPNPNQDDEAGVIDLRTQNTNTHSLNPSQYDSPVRTSGRTRKATDR